MAEVRGSVNFHEDPQLDEEDSISVRLTRPINFNPAAEGEGEQVWPKRMNGLALTRDCTNDSGWG